MDKPIIRADTFLLKKRRLRIFRIAERGTAIILWTSESLAIRYVQHRHIQKLLTQRKGQ